MHFLCGSNIDDLIDFENTSDTKNYRSICELKYGKSFYSPKNTLEAFEIFKKYRKRTYIRQFKSFISVEFLVKAITYSL